VKSEMVACKAFDPKTQVGVTGPLGFFDPAGFTAEEDEAKFMHYRRAEIKNGRAAMMATLGLAAQSFGHLPGYENVPNGLAAQWTEPGSSTLIVIFFFIGGLELGLSPWKENPEVPGDYGDPFNFGNTSVDMKNKELNNGRMAMISFLGLVAAEIYSGKAGLAQFATEHVKSASSGVRTFCGSSVLRFEKSNKSSRQAFEGKEQAGATAPLGYFDPLGLSKTQERFDKFQIAEIKHGRVAMMAMLGTLAAHWKAPGTENLPSGMAAFSDPLCSKGVIGLTLACGLLELGPWNDNNAKSPGNFGDPAGLAMDIGSDSKEMRTKEINNGRLAMLATIGLISQELATGDKYTDLPYIFGL